MPKPKPMSKKRMRELLLWPSAAEMVPKPKPISKKRKMEMMEAESKITGDRISGLPEPILQHIFSFLDMKQAVQASVLGRSWRYLWTSLPVLNFDNNVWKKRNQTKFMRFVDKVMNLRLNSAVQRFSLTYETFCPKSRIQSWISAATDWKVEEIHIVTHYEKPLVLPDCIFTSKIKVFKFHGSYERADGYLVQTPISMCSSLHLKILQLEFIILPEGDSNGELDFNCPVLESLSMSECNYRKIKTLSICSPLLVNLVLDNKNSFYDAPVKLKLSSPKLKWFKCKGSMYKELSIENSADSFSAEVDMDTSFSDGMAERMVALLKGLRNANALTIMEWSLKVFTKFPGMLEGLPANHFHLLKYFRLKKNTYISIPERYIPPVLNLLKIFSGVETLVVEVGTKFPPPRVNSFDPACLYHYTFDRLKFLEVRYFQGCETELRFLKFVFENSMLLEKVTIKTTVELQKQAGELTAFKKKLLTLAGAFNYGHIICFKD